MIRILGTVYGALTGLAFGSFLNVCITRWPAHESMVKPRTDFIPRSFSLQPRTVQQQG